MSEKLPRITASEIIRVLEKIGFSLSHSSGSHRIYRNKLGRRVTVPFHAGAILHPKLIKNILRDADITEQELKDRL